MKVTDHGGLTIRQQFTVQVTDVNEMPTKVELSNNQVSSFKTVLCTVNWHLLKKKNWSKLTLKFGSLIVRYVYLMYLKMWNLKCLSKKLLLGIIMGILIQ